jgi:hypothetical protein
MEPMQKMISPGARVWLAPLVIAILSGCTNTSDTPTAEQPGEPSTIGKTAAPTTPADTKGEVAALEATGPQATPAEATPPNQAPPKQTPLVASKDKPLFAGWEQPRVVFVLTGQQLGYIEPCGCTGLANQKGGLARRFSFLAQLRDERGWPVVPLDVGNQVKRFGKQAEIKFSRTAAGLRAMAYRSIVLGEDDLKLPAGELVAATNPDDKPSLFVGSNVAVLARDLQPQFQVIEAGGKKIGVTAVLGEKYEQKLASDELVHSPAIESVKLAADELKKLGCDFYVLLAHAPLDETKKIAQAVPDFNLVVTSGGFGEPTLELEPIAGTQARLAQVGTKGMYAVVVGLFDNPTQPLRYERVPLDDRFPDAPEMLKLLADYQAELESLGLDGLEVKPQPHPTGHSFVGSEKCGECHTKAFAIWQETPHAHATDSLVKPPNARAAIARHHDPECLSCHVTGWEPQQFYPFESGYLSLEKTPQLSQSGCENCHGPGSAHVAAEAGDVKLSDQDITRLRDQMKLPLAGGVAEQRCMQCHDLDNSPDFHAKGAIEKYWKRVEHVGKD